MANSPEYMDRLLDNPKYFRRSPKDKGFKLLIDIGLYDNEVININEGAMNLEDISVFVMQLIERAKARAKAYNKQRDGFDALVEVS